MVEVAGVRSRLVWFPSISSVWKGGHCDSSRAVVDIPEMVTSVRIPLGGSTSTGANGDSGAWRPRPQSSQPVEPSVIVTGVDPVTAASHCDCVTDATRGNNSQIALLHVYPSLPPTTLS